jgi:hypothetical protein
MLLVAQVLELVSRFDVRLSGVVITFRLATTPTSQPDSLPFAIRMISLGKSKFTRHFHVNFRSTTNVVLLNVGCYVCFYV